MLYGIKKNTHLENYLLALDDFQNQDMSQGDLDLLFDVFRSSVGTPKLIVELGARRAQMRRDLEAARKRQGKLSIDIKA